MKPWIIFAAIIVSALLEATIFSWAHIFRVKPDLLLICVIIASLFFKPRWALPLSLFAGITKDIFSLNAFGINTLLFFGWSFLIIKLSRQIVFDSKYVRLALCLIISVLNNIMTRVIFLFLGNTVSWGMFMRIVFIDSVFTVFVFFLVLKFAGRLLITGDEL